MNEITTAENSIYNGSINTELFNSWIISLHKNETDKTVETYTRAVRQFVYYLMANDITEPGEDDVVAYRDNLAIHHKPTTVQSYIMALQQFFKWTERKGYYPNISEGIKGAKLDLEYKHDYLTTSQATRLLATADRDTLKGKRDYAILALMLTAGLRTIEVARANIEDIRTVADSSVLFLQGKGHKEKSQYVKLAEPVEEAIREYLKARGKAAGTEPLFASIANRNANERMTTRSVSRIAKEHLIDAGLNSDRLTAHSLRHTTAVLNLLNGGTLEETQVLLRHSSPTTTAIYTHALERANNNSEIRVANAIFG